MTNTKFTPGPWRVRVDINGFHDVVSDDKEIVYSFVTRGVSQENYEANASLIAAAPELYAALSEAKLQIEYLHEKFAETGSGNNMLAKIDAAPGESARRMVC